MKQAVGDVLYVTQSAYLLKTPVICNYAHHYDNPEQQIDFLSFQEFLESIGCQQVNQLPSSLSTMV